MKTLIMEIRKEKRAAEPSAGSDGCPFDTALWNDHGFKYVWHRGCSLYDLQHGI